MSETKKNLSIEETAKIYGLTKSWLYKKSMSRTIPLLKIGANVLIPVEEFEQWLRNHRVDNGGKKK